MTFNLDMYRIASVPICEDGEEADLVAAQRADSFLEIGDMGHSAVWRRVARETLEAQIGSC